jgi:hypothetical protein
MTEQEAMRMAGLEMQVKSLETTLEDADKEVLDLRQQLRKANRVKLDPSNPFHQVLLDMAEMTARKGQDYAREDDMLLNFRRVSAMMDLPGLNVVEDVLHGAAMKFQRIVNLRGRQARNEAVVDSFLDFAVYAALANVAIRQEASVNGEANDPFDDE